MQITEIFQSIQGEGNSQGKNVLFIRFPMCNLCCTDCDSKFTWKDGMLESKDIDYDKWFKSPSFDTVVFTGGEPLMRDYSYSKIIEIMDKYPNFNYEIETNGTIDLTPNEIYRIIQINQGEYKVQFNISPKGNFEQENVIDVEPVMIKTLVDIGIVNGFIVKVLFDSDNDISYANQLQEKYNLKSSEIWMQPKGIDSKTLKELSLEYFDDILANGWNISLRSHIFLFENKKGV